MDKFADVAIYDRPNNEYEKILIGAIQHDSRIKVIKLNVRTLSRDENKKRSRIEKRLHPGMQLLVFKFLCPCGHTLTECFHLDRKWKRNIEVTVNFLKNRLHKHLVDEGFLQ